MNDAPRTHVRLGRERHSRSYIAVSFQGSSYLGTASFGTRADLDDWIAQRGHVIGQPLRADDFVEPLV